MRPVNQISKQEEPYYLTLKFRYYWADKFKRDVKNLETLRMLYRSGVRNALQSKRSPSLFPAGCELETQDQTLLRVDEVNCLAHILSTLSMIFSGQTYSQLFFIAATAMMEWRLLTTTSRVSDTIKPSLPMPHRAEISRRQPGLRLRFRKAILFKVTTTRRKQCQS